MLDEIGRICRIAAITCSSLGLVAGGYVATVTCLHGEIKTVFGDISGGTHCVCGVAVAFLCALIIAWIVVYFCCARMLIPK